MHIYGPAIIPKKKRDSNLDLGIEALNYSYGVCWLMCIGGLKKTQENADWNA
jgi:hypothetical protein